MEQQTIRIEHNRLPPPFPTRVQHQLKRADDGGAERPAARLAFAAR
jgi:hypothetical protein